jgi:hypothetical protein
MNQTGTNCFSIEFARIRILKDHPYTQHYFKLRIAVGVLAEHGQPHGDVKPIEISLGRGRDPVQEAADTVAAVGR